MKPLLVLVLFCVANVQGQILIYKSSFSSTQMGNGFTWKESTPGYVVVDTGTGAAGEFSLYPAWKEYSFRNKTLTVESVDAGHGKLHTVFAEILISTNASTPAKFSSTAKGLNVSLDVGLAEKRRVPRTMQFVSRDVFRFGIIPFIEEGAGTLRIDLPGTQSANSAHKTLDEVVAIIRADLAERGFSDNHP